MRLVIDASSALFAAADPGGFDVLRAHELLAPPLLLSEVSSVLHEQAWRRSISPELARLALASLGRGTIRIIGHERLHDEAWRVADSLGWAKTYDAEYVGLARLLGCRLLTSDARLARAARRLVEVVEPNAL